jgi:hypothetical protein
LRSPHFWRQVLDGEQLKPRYTLRPDVIYREEVRNGSGEWWCSRMSYNPDQYSDWRNWYREMIKGGRPPWFSERRYVRGWVEWEWEEDPN